VPALRAASTTNAVSATATGLTGLDNAGTDFSWGAWLRTDPPLMSGGQSSIWVHANDAASPRHGIAIFALGTGELRIRPQTSANNLVSSPNGLVTRQYNHFGIRKNATAVTFFRNGRAVAQVATTLSPTVSGTRQTQIGGPTFGGIQALHGVDVWDIRVFPLLALSDAEMALLANPRSDVAGCKQRLIYQHAWRVAGTGAVTLLDESGSGNSLTTSGTTELAAVIEEPDWYNVLHNRRVFGRAAGGTLYTQALTASVTPSATLERRTARAVGASVTPTATVVKHTARALAASVTPAGAVGAVRAYLRSLAASMTPTATVTRRTARTLAASVTPAATVTKRTARALAASVTATASVVGTIVSLAVVGLVRSVLTWTAAVRATLTRAAAPRADITTTPAASAEITRTPSVQTDITHDTDG